MAIATTRFQKIVLPIMGALMFCMCGCMVIFDAENKNAAAVPPLDLSQVSDGTYLGYHLAKGIDYGVEVTIGSNMIREIKVISGLQRVFVKKCALCEVNQLIWEIIEQQSIDVDALSGATQTSMAIRHAVADALTPPFAPR